MILVWIYGYLCGVVSFYIYDSWYRELALAEERKEVMRNDGAPSDDTNSAHADDAAVDSKR